MTYTYNNEDGSLTGMNTGPFSISYSYNYTADGVRTSKTVDGVVHTYFYSGTKLLRETYGTTVLDFFYDANGTPYALKQGSTTSDSYNTYYYVTNLQGDVIRLVDIYGNIAAMYKYDPFGNTVHASGSHATINPLRYRGYYYDTETKLYYCISRYYDPAIGRWISADAYASTGQGILGHNMFAYCGNNPVCFADYWGTAPNHFFATCYSYDGYAYIFSEGQAITLSIRNDSIYVDAYMTFSGDVDSEYLIQGIERYWGGSYSYGSKTVNVYINIYYGESSGGHTINVNTSNSYGRSYCTKNRFSWASGKESTITLYADYYQNVGCDWTIAHEFGHSLGIGDYYVMSAAPGFDSCFPSIMNLPGYHAMESDIQKMVYAFAYNVPQNWYCAGEL